MILLDSDHLTVLKYRDSERYGRLTTRLQAVAMRRGRLKHMKTIN